MGASGQSAPVPARPVGRGAVAALGAGAHRLPGHRPGGLVTAQDQPTPRPVGPALSEEDLMKRERKLRKMLRQVREKLNETT